MGLEGLEPSTLEHKAPRSATELQARMNWEGLNLQLRHRECFAR